MTGNQGGSATSRHIHHHIEQKMKQENVNTYNHSLLLLGLKNSGKSTLMRQMRHIWGRQFETKERQKYRNIVWQNVTECMQILCEQSLKLSQQTHIEECEIDEKNIDSLNFTLKLNKLNLPTFDHQIYEVFQALWNDKGIQNTFLHRDKFYIMDSAEYFLNNMRKYIGNDYVPTFDEICRCKVKSIGIRQETFIFNKRSFTVYDLDGQNSEKRRYLNFCDNVRAIIYITSLAGYNQVLFEDNKTNLLMESFNLYDQCVNHDALRDINILLFLNKADLFDTMIKTIPFTVCRCDDYKDDPHDKDSIIQYIIRSYQKKTIYIYTYYMLYKH